MIEILYDATGVKLRKKTTAPDATIITTDYSGGIEYVNGELISIYHSEGRVVVYETQENIHAPVVKRYRHEYVIRDHLGNSRVTFSDLNGDNVIQPLAEKTQENNYYSFGLNMEGPWSGAASGYKYQYNGKELNDDFGLGWNDYGARWYDAAVGRFFSLDRYAEKYSSWSTFHYANNNPIAYIDINGDSTTYSNEEMKAFVEKYSSPTKITKKGKEITNPHYNETFAKKVDELNGSTEMFEFTDDITKLSAGDPNQLGEFGIAADGSRFYIVVPDFTSGELYQNLDLFGGREAVLAEETFHATQYLAGDLQKELIGGVYRIQPGAQATYLSIEVDAKIWAANSGLANLETTNYFKDYTLKTSMGLIQESSTDREKVATIITQGATGIAKATFGNMPNKPVTHNPGYRSF